jgi:hypothetical protein
MHDTTFTWLNLLRFHLIFVEDTQHKTFQIFCAIHPLYNSKTTTKRNHLKQGNVKYWFLMYVPSVWTLSSVNMKWGNAQRGNWSSSVSLMHESVEPKKIQTGFYHLGNHIRRYYHHVCFIFSIVIEVTTGKAMYCIFTMFILAFWNSSYLPCESKYFNRRINRNALTQKEH